MNKVDILKSVLLSNKICLSIATHKFSSETPLTQINFIGYNDMK